MNPIARETRRLSHEEIMDKKETRRAKILELLESSPDGMTANEIADNFHRRRITQNFDRNFVHPRLNELEKAGKVEITGKRICKVRGKMCSVYEVV